MKFMDLAGQRFGRWVVLERAPSKPKVTLWLCRCDCGRLGTPHAYDLRGGKSVSCGCFKTEVTRARVLKHGESDSRLHRIWRGMRKRCLNPSAAGYANYGGRGVAICPEWNTFTLFRDWALTNGYDDALSIERVDVNGDYAPRELRLGESRAAESQHPTSAALALRGSAFRCRRSEWGLTQSSEHPGKAGLAS